MHISSKNRKKVIEGIKKGRIDAADIGTPNFIDAMLLAMHRAGVTKHIEQIVEDRRSANRSIPFVMLWILSIAAKMKQRMSISDIPYAMTDAEALSELGYALWDEERPVSEGLMDEGVVRKLIGKYEKEELVRGYNRCVGERMLVEQGIQANTHILDCTKLHVNLDNENFEGSSVARDDDGVHRGYKLATLRGVVGDGGIIEEIRLGTMKEHDLSLSREMILTSERLRPGDILVNDRGFLSREVMNALKTERGVDTYIPLKKGMIAYEDAVSIAKMEGKWHVHPNKKRKTQKICFVGDIGIHWISEEPEKDVPLNSCVAWDTKDDEYYVFVTTDEQKTAKQIIQTYEIRPEIEEDYRQLKDFWMLETFSSTKLAMVTFHIVCTLLGYLFFQLYTATEEGVKWAGKSLPVLMKKYSVVVPKSVIIYVGQYFEVFPFIEFIQLYASLSANVRVALDGILGKV